MSNNFTNFELAKAFLSSTPYALLEYEEDGFITLSAQMLASKRNVKLKNYVPHNYFVKVVYDRAVVKAKLYFSDTELLLDFGEALESFKENWQTYVYYSLPKKESIDYLKYLESQMVEEFREIDRTYIDLMMEDPDKEWEYVDLHDKILKQRTLDYNYLRDLEREAGITHHGYDPFHHPFMNPERKKPERLVDIVARRNEFVRNQAIESEEREEI